MNYIELIRNFYNEQLESWQLLKNNVAALEKVELREFTFDGFEFTLQHNPARITSTSADVSTSTIKNRKCFLCRENRPIEQREFIYNNEFIILANPFPILKKHLTITSVAHVEQSIESNFQFLLEITQKLGERYSIYYNGPRCGASAPDHLHFQAGTRNCLPIEIHYNFLKNRFFKKIFDGEQREIFSIENVLRNGIVLESSKTEQLINWFAKVCEALKEMLNETVEPMMNIISTYQDGLFRLIIFPRSVHRPKEYFAEGADKILISPAVMDLGGLLITPRKADFEKLTEEDIKRIFQQVMLKDSDHQTFIKNFISILQR